VVAVLDLLTSRFGPVHPGIFLRSGHRGKPTTTGGARVVRWPDQRKEVVHSMNSHGTLEVAGR
jgi:hypothetical protein